MTASLAPLRAWKGGASARRGRYGWSREGVTAVYISVKGYILYDEMNAFEPAPLTTGGLPVMREEEVELKADTDGIHFYSQKGKTKQGEL